MTLTRVFRRRRLLVAAAIAAATALRCAGTMAPSGGPPDTSPPEVTAVSPLPRQLEFHGQKISLAFSKYVTRRTVEESLFLSPPAGEPAFDWGSQEVSIVLPESLRPQTTYILTLGTDVVDMRQNHLAKAFALPFSTGSEIDSCSISGKVYDEDARGVMLFCYRLDGRNRDTLRPAWTKPSYVTQTGAGGAFTIPYLAYGSYRVVAVRDAYKNLVYDVQTDEYGAPSADYTVTRDAPGVTGLHFRLAREDTSPPFLSSAKPPDRSHLLLRFNEAIDPASFVPDSIAIFDTASRAPLAIRLASLREAKLDAFLVTSSQGRGTPYRIVVRGVRDAAGNRMRPEQATTEFIGSGEPDTSKPVLVSVSPSDRKQDAGVTDSIRFLLSEPVARASFEASFRLVDTSRAPVGGTFVWLSAESPAFIPAKLAYGTQYRMTLRLDSLRDEAGNHGPDSTLSVRFTTIDEKMLSSISGTVADGRKEGGGAIYVTATEISGGSPHRHTVQVQGPGPFAFLQLPEGTYTLSAFRDQNGDGLWSPGMVFPFKTAERFAAYPDTLKLRARWPLEGAELKLQE